MLVLTRMYVCVEAKLTFVHFQLYMNLSFNALTLSQFEGAYE